MLKDLYQDYAGVRATSGSAAYKRVTYVPRENSEIVNRWLRAGVVIFGRTNTPEFGAKGITEPTAWGPTRNPWDLTRSPGGSSGGSAAVVSRVVWHTFGHTHFCKPEDFPVMPVEYAGFSLKPSGFFAENPAMDLAAAPNQASVRAERAG